MAEEPAVVPLQHPELRAGSAEAALGEAHLHVQERDEALLEDLAFLLGGVAERVELRLELERDEGRPVLGGVQAQTRHGRVLAKCGPGSKVPLASVVSFRLKEQSRR